MYNKSEIIASMTKPKQLKQNGKRKLNFHVALKLCSAVVSSQFLKIGYWYTVEHTNLRRK